MKKTHQENTAQILYAAFRIIIGLMFTLHGASKFGLIGEGSIRGFASTFSLPLWLAALVAAIELIGGILIALGLMTRLSAAFGGIVMLVAIVMVHIPKGPWYNPLANGAELPLMFIASFLVMLAYGSGRYGIEKAITDKELL